MSFDAMRLWGIAASAVLVAGALVFSITAPAPAAFAQAPIAHIAQATPAAEPAAFLVRFQGRGPIAAAQREAQRGRTVAAQRVIEAQLARQSGFAGLCFDRFTVGAAEVVLRTCESVAVSDRAGVQQSWVARLRAMRAIAYVDPNAVASQGRAG
ncbi:MAG TPA: hypothetical protein PKY87_03895 [Terricaulis sp.]|nr:hypothetical protein [Terricaulis sp.]